MDIEAKVVEVFRLYEVYGRTEYVGERVTTLEHSVQCAEWAERDGASMEIIVAAFLHDIGHLLGLDRKLPAMLTQGRVLGAVQHEFFGGEFLRQMGFPDVICDIVRGHVNAKRYLVSQNEDYYNKLSQTSKETLEHQGGKMTVKEAEEFEHSTSFETILRMRTWDERAKDTTMTHGDGVLDKYKHMCSVILSNVPN